MFGLGIPEIAIILLAIGILLFGSKKIIEVARSMGRFTGEFKKGKKEIETEIKSAEESAMGDSTNSDVEENNKV